MHKSDLLVYVFLLLAVSVTAAAVATHAMDTAAIGAAVIGTVSAAQAARIVQRGRNRDRDDR